MAILQSALRSLGCMRAFNRSHEVKEDTADPTVLGATLTPMTLEQAVAAIGPEKLMEILEKGIENDGHGAMGMGRIHAVTSIPIAIAYARRTTSFSDLDSCLTLPYLIDATYDAALSARHLKIAHNVLNTLPGYSEDAGHDQHQTTYEQFEYPASSIRRALTLLQQGGDAIAEDVLVGSVDWDALRTKPDNLGFSSL